MKVLSDVVVPARSGKGFVVKKGQRIRVIEVDGGQIGDFVVFNEQNLRERFNQARTKSNQGKIFITTGDRLYSKFNNVLMTITEDTYGIHDLQYGMCSRWIYESGQYRSFTEKFTIGGPLGVPSWGCWENLTEALKGWNIPPEDIPDPLNIFQTVEIDIRTGRMGIVNGRSKPGDSITFRAEMDCLAALSACPSTGRPLRVQVSEE